MHLQYLNGTSQQHTWLEEALSWAFDVADTTFWDPEFRDSPRFGEPPHTHDPLIPLFFPQPMDPTDRFLLSCVCQVEVEWVPESQIPVPPGASGLIVFAETTLSGQMDWYQAHMEISNDLDTRGGPFGGEAFYKETVVHEFMHVWQGVLDDAGRDAVIAAFGGGSWAGGSWGSQVREAAAETMKDLFAGEGQRRYSNRTNKKLNRANLLELVRPFYIGPPPEWEVVDYLPPEGLDPKTEASVGIVVGTRAYENRMAWPGAWPGGAFQPRGDNPPHGAQYGTPVAVPQTVDEVYYNAQRWDCEVEIPAVAGMNETLGAIVTASWGTGVGDLTGEGWIYFAFRLYDADDNLVIDASNGVIDGNLEAHFWDIANLGGREFRITLGDWPTYAVNKEAFSNIFLSDPGTVKTPLRLETRIGLRTGGALGAGGPMPSNIAFEFSHSVETVAFYYVPQWPLEIAAGVPGEIRAAPAGAGNRPRKPTRGSASPGVVLG